MKMNRTTNKIEFNNVEKKILKLYYNGFKAKDIANRVGITTSKVYRTIYRIRQVQEVKRWWE